MAIGGSWADGAWVDAGWVVGAWDAKVTISAWGEAAMVALITNTAAIQDTDNRFNVCQFSGFRALPDELVESGYGELVLPKFAEPRQMQERVRVKAEQLEGSPRNEIPDTFITTEITIDDL